MAITRNEQRIYKLVEDKKKYSVSALDKLIKAGANINAVADDDIENSWSFAVDLMYMADKDIDKFEMLKCFCNNGFDLKRFAKDIILNYEFISFKTTDVIEMTDYILDRIDTSLDFSDVIEDLEMECSFLAEDDYYAKRLSLYKEVLGKLQNYQTQR